MAKLAYSASVRHLNLRHLEQTLCALTAAGIDALHFEVRDGAFAPGFALGYEIIQAAKQCCDLPCHAHLLVQHPERHIDALVTAGCDAIAVHVEASSHAHRVLGQIRDAGAAPGIAILPATPLTKLSYVLPLAENVLVLGREPGETREGVLPATFERIRILHENIVYQKYSARITAAGGLDAASCAKAAHFGAACVVLDHAAIFNQTAGDPAQAFPGFCEQVAAYVHTV